MIVVGSVGGRGLKALLGSTSDRPSTDTAVQWALQLIERGPCQFVAMHVSWPPEDYARLAIDAPMHLDRTHPLVEQVIRRELDSVASRLKGSGETKMASAPSALPAVTAQAPASAPLHWKRANNHRGAAAFHAVRGVAATAAADTGCSDIAPLQLYRFVEPLDTCMQPMTPADIAALGDPFAMNVLAQGLGNAAKWPTDVETVVSLVAAVPSFGTKTRRPPARAAWPATSTAR